MKKIKNLDWFSDHHQSEISEILEKKNPKAYEAMLSTRHNQRQYKGVKICVCNAKLEN